MSIGKWLVLGVWVFAIVGTLMGEGSTMSKVATGTLWFLVIAHALECVIFSSRIRAAGGSLMHHLVQTMIFGLFHIQTLPSGRHAM